MPTPSESFRRTGSIRHRSRIEYERFFCSVVIVPKNSVQFILIALASDRRGPSKVTRLGSSSSDCPLLEWTRLAQAGLASGVACGVVNAGFAATYSAAIVGLRM